MIEGFFSPLLQTWLQITRSRIIELYKDFYFFLSLLSFISKCQLIIILRFHTIIFIDLKAKKVVEGLLHGIWVLIPWGCRLFVDEHAKSYVCIENESRTFINLFVIVHSWTAVECRTNNDRMKDLYRLKIRDLFASISCHPGSEFLEIAHSPKSISCVPHSHFVNRCLLVLFRCSC